MLAAGSGTRLRPLTNLRPKALCPVDDVALLDRALDRVTPHVADVAVNAWHLHDQVTAHLADRPAHVSVEEPEALETAGALGNLRDWIDGRDVLVCNSDVYHPDPLDGFVTGWDRERVRLLTVDDPTRGDFDDLRYTGVALVPWPVVRGLPARRLGLYSAVIEPAREGDRLDLVTSAVTYHDCGTPREYLDANLAASGGESVAGAGATIDGTVERSVVWSGARVAETEHLVDAIRATDGVTVHVQRPA